MITTTITIETQLRLMCWLSPSFPTGAFAYSHGLEWAVEERTIRDGATLVTWLEDLLRHGSLWTDAVLVQLAYRNPHETPRLAELAAALAGTRERRHETIALGNAFAAAAKPWTTPELAALPDNTPFPIVFAVLAASHQIPLNAALAGFLHASVSNLVSAAVRLVPLGQSAGLACQRALESQIAEIAQNALSASEDDLGGSAFSSDIASMRHETQYTRLFRT